MLHLKRNEILQDLFLNLSESIKKIHCCYYVLVLCSKLLGRSLQDSDDLELQLLIAEVLLKLYLKKGFDLLLQDLIPGLPEAVLQTEDLYAQNELYRCIKHILKPIGTTPSATNNTVTLNCQVSIDGCLLIEHEVSFYICKNKELFGAYIFKFRHLVLSLSVMIKMIFCHHIKSDWH